MLVAAERLTKGMTIKWDRPINGARKFVVRDVAVDNRDVMIIIETATKRIRPRVERGRMIEVIEK